MIHFSSKLRLSIVACLWFVIAPLAQAQLDRVYDMDGDNVSGAVKQTSKDGVQLDKAGNVQNFMAGEILKIMFEGDPATLTKAREFALDGQYESALSELKNVNFDAITRDVIKQDVAFYIAMCEANLALAGKGKLDEAVRKTLAFAGNNRNSWHFYDAAKLLGDMALASNNSEKALSYYKTLAQAPSADMKIESRYLQGLVHLKMGQSDAAAAEFDKVLGLKAQTSQTARLQSLCKAGKAVAEAQKGNGAEGLQVVKGLIAEMNPADVELAARIYNAQGASYEANDDPEGAIMAYLHTHLMFSAQPDAHAEALKKLVELWPQVGKPERAAEARQELQKRYPGF
ncbi:MAG: tetratricopeptide repeat protein [Rubripirellula sp.]